jgi:hypothetical protein
VEAGDGVPADVPLGVKGPIGGDVDHRPVGRDVDGEFEQERFVVLHAIEVPAQAERIERGVKNIFRRRKLTENDGRRLRSALMVRRITPLWSR